jgi:hypothetical protein
MLKRSAIFALVLVAALLGLQFALPSRLKPSTSLPQLLAWGRENAQDSSGGAELRGPQSDPEMIRASQDGAEQAAQAAADAASKSRPYF